MSDPESEEDEEDEVEEGDLGDECKVILGESNIPLDSDGHPPNGIWAQSPKDQDHDKAAMHK